MSYSARKILGNFSDQMLVKLVLDVNFMFHVDANLTEKLRQYNCKVTSIEVKNGKEYLFI